METTKENTEDNIGQQNNSLNALPDSRGNWAVAAIGAAGCVTAVYLAVRAGFDGYNTELFAYFALALFGAVIARQRPSYPLIITSFGLVIGGACFVAYWHDTATIADTLPDAVLSFALAYMAELIILGSVIANKQLRHLRQRFSSTRS